MKKAIVAAVQMNSGQNKERNIEKTKKMICERGRIGNKIVNENGGSNLIGSPSNLTTINAYDNQVICLKDERPPSPYISGGVKKEP